MTGDAFVRFSDELREFRLNEQGCATMSYEPKAHVDSSDHVVSNTHLLYVRILLKYSVHSMLIAPNAS